MSKDSSKSNTALIVIAIIGALSTICAASIGAMTTYNVEKMRQDSELTRIALVSTATQAGITQEAMQNILSIPTSTPEPPLPTYTFQPTFTAYPTYTALPTNVPLPTQDIILPFFDNFDAGLDPGWRILTGTPLITDGRLKSVSDRLIIETGNESLKNLTLTFDLAGVSMINPRYNMYLSIGKNVRFYFANPVRMQVFENNQWVDLDGSRVDFDYGHTFKIIALNNNYEIYSDGQLLRTYQYGSSNSGPIQISMTENIRLDNFSLSSP
jgi:type II secretory pathway pseudopilin PulG